MSFNPNRYKRSPSFEFPERTWPNRRVSASPRWCAVDLRDGNQALSVPMDSSKKLRLFELLVRMGYREIEVGFPAASQTDFDFVRKLIEEQRIPENVTIQVLVPARLELIERTFAAISGAKRVIVHLYNSTSVAQRRIVFGMSTDEVRSLAVQGTRWVKHVAQQYPEIEVNYEYSPESFTATELPFALEICNAVVEEWNPSRSRKMIVNLPATVEVSTPNVYADQIEWMCQNLRRRAEVIVSVHAHNDRGCAVAATELALLAGAERVEGTLFGNGERTGNVDLVTLGMNLYSQGIDPLVDFSSLPEACSAFEECCQMSIGERHPYVGALVFTAFSGSHQDAIRKGLAAMSEEANSVWEVPYLPIDPADIGRTYEPLVRINSQSGKGGIAFVLERTHGYRVPRGLAVEFGQIVQRIADATGTELPFESVCEVFEREYLGESSPFVSLKRCDVRRERENACSCEATVVRSGVEKVIRGCGQGPVEAFVKAVNYGYDVELHCVDYAEHALAKGNDAMAVAYVGLSDNGHVLYGVGKARDITMASLRAVLSATNRLMTARRVASGVRVTTL